MGYKIEGGGFKPEEATDKLTCPCVRGYVEGDRRGHSKVLGEELNLVNVGSRGTGWVGNEGMGVGRGG